METVVALMGALFNASLMIMIVATMFAAITLDPRLMWDL